MARYHWRDNVYFERLSDGSVEIEFPVEDGTIHYEIPPAEWASIVAAVSVDGENAESYREAQSLHDIPRAERGAEAPEAGKPRLAPCTCGCTEGRA